MNWDGHSRQTGELYEAYQQARKEWRIWHAVTAFGLMVLIAALLVLIIAMPARADSEGAVTPGTLAVRSMLNGCTFTTTPPTAVSGQQFAIQCDPFGGVKSSVYPAAATPVTNSSGNVAASAAVATLAAAAGKTTFICGFTMTSAGSTAAAVVSPTVVGTLGGTMTYTYASVAGATLANLPLQNGFTPCVPASAANTAIVVTLPSLGAGNTNATAVAWGFQQ
jgi:hypothetical protein